MSKKANGVENNPHPAFAEFICNSPEISKSMKGIHQRHYEITYKMSSLWTSNLMLRNRIVDLVGRLNDIEGQNKRKKFSFLEKKDIETLEIRKTKLDQQREKCLLEFFD